MVAQPGIGDILATGIPLAQPGVPQTPVPAPVLGADTDAVLRGLLNEDGG
jgi:2-methylfumaryl-CoA isomerase